MPKLNLHLYTDKAIEPEDIKWNDSLLAKDVVINRHQQKKALKVILCNVVKYRDAEILYSRAHVKKKPIEHNPFQLSNKTIYNVVDKLRSNGLVTEVRGDAWFTKDQDEVKLSVFKANKKLLDLADSLGIQEEEIEERQLSYMELKDDRKNYVEYKPTPYSELIQQRMSEICTYLNEQHITYKEELLTPFHLVRKYQDYDNSKEFKYGGRAYATYMSLPPEERAKIKINGQSVKSHDYSASLTSIVYNKIKGIPRQEVPTRVQPYDVLALDRSVVKQYMNTLLNATKQGFSGGINSFYNHPKRTKEEVDAHKQALHNFGGKINNIRDAVIELNQDIEHVFLKGKHVGNHFSWIEANLVHEVQHYACRNWDIPCLTVYDEFIVPEENADAMEELLYTVGMPDEYLSDHTKTIIDLK